MSGFINISEQVLNWSIQAGVTLLLLFACYYLLFRNNTALKLRRSLLLSLVAVSLLGPFIELPESSMTPEVYVPKIELARTQLVQSNDEVNESRAHETTLSETEKVSTPYSTTDYITIVFITGIFISFLVFIAQLTRIFWLVRKGTTEWQKGILLIRHSSVKSPFSFLNWIFVPTEKYDDDTWKILMAHEHAHLQQKHSLDILFTRSIATLIWYNPVVYLIIQELRQIHELLADKQVLKATSVKEYSKTLLAFSFDTSPKLTQAFSLKTSIKKRLVHMQQSKTKLRKSVILTTVFCIVSISIIGITSLQAQQKPDVSSKIIPADIKKLMSFPFKIGIINKLSPEHSKAYDLLKTENPDKNIHYRYYEHGDFTKYFESFEPGIKPIYIDELTNDQKDFLYNEFKTDTSKITVGNGTGSEKTVEFFTYFETVPDLHELISKQANYIMIYESTPKKLSDEGIIYEPYEVDEIPEVVGGVDNLAKSVALNVDMPSTLDRSKLPDTIDFSFVIMGGKSISHINLLTELKGSDKKNAPYYKFFGEVHNEIRSKIGAIYSWKRGVKNGEEVLVRMTLNIPTKYIQ
ncbi:M56 family metallopeptidase [Roseivirga pacifica]|uniref:M56 family metallopeptidase n=1 Tax=Roseivirga pacifica TaxID=1267423 RepID=UPI003BB18B06